MNKVYVRDQDWESYLGKRLRIIRGTTEVAGTMKGHDAALFPMLRGERAKPWVLTTEDGTDVKFVASDGWELYEE